MQSTEKELDILEAIHRSTTPVRQRNIAEAIGLSLGMTNVIVKRLAKKGWITVRRANSRNIQYIVSPRGIDEIARRSYRYLRRTLGNIVRYKKAIEDLVREAKARGCTEVALRGESDLEFLLEYACEHQGLQFQVLSRDGKEADRRRAPGRLLVVSEASIGPSRRRATTVFLRDVLMRE
jgi:DNA-binding MarR family transcriptional regulator